MDYKFSLTDFAPFAKAKTVYDRLSEAIRKVEQVPLDELVRRAEEYRKQADDLVVDALLDEKLKRKADEAKAQASKAAQALSDERSNRAALRAARDKAGQEIENCREQAEMFVYQKAIPVHKEQVQRILSALREVHDACAAERELHQKIVQAIGRQPNHVLLTPLAPTVYDPGDETNTNSFFWQYKKALRQYTHDV